jgi:membrane protease YdiL (CAAX protease family)
VLPALVLPSVTAWFYFVALAGSGQLNLWQQVVYVGGKAVQFALPVLFLVLARRMPWPKEDIFKGVGIGIGFGLLAGFAILCLYFAVLRGSPVMATMALKVREKIQELGVGTPLRFLALAAFICVGHSLLEEFYWRWFVFGQLKEVFPVPAAVVVSSLGFMAHHVIILAVYLPGQFFTAVVPLSLGVAVGGAFWAWLYERTGSLMGCWLGHLLVDAAIFVVGWHLVFA